MTGIPYRAETFTLDPGQTVLRSIEGQWIYLKYCALPFLLLQINEEPTEELFARTKVSTIFRRFGLTNPHTEPCKVTVLYGRGEYDDYSADNPTAPSAPVHAVTYNGSRAVGTAPILLAPADPTRVGLLIHAGDADLWIGPSDITATGVPTLAKLGSLSLQTKAAVYGIRSVGPMNAGVMTETVA